VNTQGGRADYDVVVVGGGVAGCACALELAERGLAVLLLERSMLAAGASGRNQGLLLPNPDPAYHEPFREGVAAYERLAAGPVPFGLRPTGLLFLAGDETTLTLAKGHAQALTAGGFAVEALGPEELVQAEPCLAPDLAGGFRVDGARALDPASVTLAWAEAARRAGAVVRTHDGVRGLIASNGRTVGVVAESGPVAAGAVVDAAGPWSRQVAGWAGAELPVGGARGWLVGTGRLPWRLEHAFEETTWPGPEGVGSQARLPTFAEVAAGNAAGDGTAPGEGDAFTIQQAPSGQATLGASLHVSLRDDPEYAETVHGLARRALRFVPGLAEVAVTSAWSGVRPVTTDGYPLVGPVPGADGLWALAGHGPEGVLLAPATARMLANHLTSGRADPDAAPFDPARLVSAERTDAGGHGRA
jgi:D-hydroxyproline dehydrogenase subunit beta